MRVEVDNAIRNIEDIRRAVLSLRGQTETVEAVETIDEINELADQMEFKVRGLEFELNG